VLVGFGFLHRVEILPEEVLHQGQLHAFGVGCLANNRGDAVETGHSGGPPPALTGDDLPAVGAGPPDDHRLNHARGLERSS
jgi:hypothetical protein